MNREIKFRGKEINTGEWEYGFYTQGSWIDPNTGKEKVRHIIHADFWYDVVPETAGQYTGLKDKNGKEIYEGDILRVKEYKNFCWDLSKSREDFDEIKRTFTLDDLKGELDKEYISAVAVEEGTYCLSSNGDYNDTYLSCLFGDMKCSQPIFDFEVIGNIHDDPKLLNHVVR